MGPKRGRPISSDLASEAVNHRRQKTRERVQQFRQRQRASQALRTPTQLAQGEHVIDLALSIVEETAPTPMQLGLRVQGATLAQDPYSAELQQDALPIDEHQSLYQEDSIAPQEHQQRASISSSSSFFRQFAIEQASSQPQVPNQRYSGLSRYFPTLPTTNPIALNAETARSETPEANSLSAQRDIEVAIRHTPQTPSKDSDISDFDIDVGGEGVGSEGSNEVEGTVWGDNAIPVLEEQRTDNQSIPTSSPIIFATEHSSPSIRVEGGEVEVSAQEYSAQKLFEQLQGGFHGCSDNEHKEKHREHMRELGDRHNGLSSLFNDSSFPSVLGMSEIISADRLSRQQMPTSDQWQAMFCGTAPRPTPLRPRPMHVCLHTEETQAVEPQVAFDIDSFLGFASSLAMARQGLWYQPAPQMRQNITADNHLQMDWFSPGTGPEQPERAASSMLRDVPHFLLGRIVGAHDITLHILFPHIAVIGDKFHSLTGEQLSRWLDQVFHPSVYKYCEAHYTQHLPASSRHAYANSKAHQTEGRKIETASYQAQQAIGYHLQPEYLEQIWEDILDTIAATPGLADFREPQLFFSAKGTKLQFKTSPSRPTLLDAIDNFVSYFERVVDLDFVELERMYVDIGKEICPRVSLLPSQRYYVGDEAQVYAWRRCCLERYMQWAYDGSPPSLGQGQRYYEQNMLYEACSLTSVTPKRSRLREGGLIYSQFYGSVKEISDAAKCMPFDNDGLEELALDPQILRGARQAAGGHRRDTRIIEQAYCASKRRAKVALQDSMGKSFGIREEHRVSWGLFQNLRDRLGEEDPESLQVVLLDCPPYAWAVKTQVYLDFLWRSADKFATGFEVARARCRQGIVTWEQTKVMVMFLRCLRYVFGGHDIRRESALWWSRRERTIEEPPGVKVWYGLGFCNTMKRYGYCWIEPRVDWDRLQFQTDITDDTLFGNAVLRRQYLRRGGQVQAFFDLTRRMDLALHWLEAHYDHRRAARRMLSWMVSLCLEQFRKDVLSSIKHEVLEQHREDALEGKVGFCMEYFEEIMEEGVHLVSGNRCDFKHASGLGEYLFNYHDGMLRKHWEEKPYRKLYQRAHASLLGQRDGRAKQGTFREMLFQSLYSSHWILPYPSPEVFLQTTKQGQRMWYSIVRDSSPAHSRTQGAWKWGRKSWEAGRPSNRPDWADWGKEEWEQWLSRAAVRRGRPTEAGT